MENIKNSGMHKSQNAFLLENDVAQQEGIADSFGGGGGGSESYSSNSSFTDSYSNSSDLANWEEYVAEDGSLFYAEYIPYTGVATNDDTAKSGPQSLDFTRTPSMRLEKKIRKQQQQKQRTQNKQQLQRQQQQEQQEFLFSHIKPYAQCKELELVITANDRYRYGRRSTAVESILGFRVVAFQDQPECLMVTDFIHNTPGLQQTTQESINRGDWFKSLDNIDIRTSNVDDLLMQFIQPTKVVLKFLGRNDTLANDDSEKTQPSDEAFKRITSFSTFTKAFEEMQLGSCNSAETNDDLKMPFAMMVISPKSNQHEEYDGSIFYYPDDRELNFLYKARGGFLTLNSVFTNELNSRPLLSKMLVNDIQYFVFYRIFGDFLVLFAFNGQSQTLKEATLRTDELMLFLKFTFPSMHAEKLTKNNQDGRRLHELLHNLAHMQFLRIMALYRQNKILFEELLPESRCMPLPKEAQLRIFDALSEMEAMDYRDWNDEPLNTHREFFIHGSVLYFEHFMLVSQLPVEARAQVESFMKCRGIFDFIARRTVKEMYVWQEIELPNANGRYFLTIYSKKKLILAVILKLFDVDPTSCGEQVPPSLFYIEEIQETLDHLIQCGIESLARFWAMSNKRPEVLEKIDAKDAGTTDVNKNAERHASKIETLIKQKLTISSQGPSTSIQAAARVLKNDEEPHLCTSLMGSSQHSQTPSDDDSSKRRIDTNTEDSDSDGGSDWEGFTMQNPLHYGDATCQAEMTESLWREINNVLPVNISPGWKNSIYYYIYIDSANGTIFCPMKVNNTEFPFMRELRLAFHTIHDILLGTKNLDQQSSSESATSSSTYTFGTRGIDGKIPIKEHGMTIEVCETSQQESGAAGGEKAKKATGEQDGVKSSFSVVGRLFTSPAREVYICHRPDVPQNMVEMAFRLSFFTVG